MEKVTEDRVA